jgi:hypothetical protein
VWGGGGWGLHEVKGGCLQWLAQGRGNDTPPPPRHPIPPPLSVSIPIGRLDHHLTDFPPPLLPPNVMLNPPPSQYTQYVMELMNRPAPHPRR